MPRFTKGTSGNPTGRPRGSKNKVTRLRESLAAHLPAVLEELVRQAKEGDLQAMKLLLDRTVPALRPVDAPVMVPASGTLSEQGNAVAEQLLGGQITPNEGAAMLGALASLARLVEVDELVKRVETLEQTRGEWRK